MEKLKRNRIFKGLSFLLVLVALTACSEHAKEDTTGYTQISTEEAKSLMESEENYIILDVRTKEEYEEKHIPGAVLVPNETIGEDEIPQLPDKDQMILVYCRSGNRSKQAAEKLVALGYTNVVEFGGINDWTGKVVSGDE